MREGEGGRGRVGEETLEQGASGLTPHVSRR
jgi:hypothetical protein